MPHAHRPPDDTDAPAPAPAAVDSVLERVTRFLVSSAGADVHGVLGVLGTALQADWVYFVATPAPAFGQPGPSGVPPAPTYLSGRVVTWARDGVPVPEGIGDEGPEHAPGDGALAVPLLGEDERLIGYLGVGPSALGDMARAPYDRVLSVVSDVIGTHLSRLALEEARVYTEQRWRQLVDRHPDPTLVAVGGVVTYANANAAALLGAPDAGQLAGYLVEDFVSAEEAGRVSEARDVQLQTANPVPFEHVVIRFDGDVRTVESVSVPFPGVEGGVQTVLRDLTERRAGEERYRTFVQTTSDGVWRVKLGVPVSRETPPRVLADHVIAHGWFAEVNPAMTKTLGIGHRSAAELPLRRLVGPYGRLLVRALAASGFALRAHEIAARGGNGTARHFSVSAIGRFERDDLVEIWGSCAEITERVEMERQLVAVLEEQQERIGRDLHDSVGQLLAGVRMMGDGLAARAAGTDLAETAARIAAYSAEALDRVRAICHGLVPPQLYSEGAAGALAELVDHVDQLGPVRCVFRQDDHVDLRDPDAALQAYRIVQEAVSNALRHSGGETIWVTLGDDGRDVIVEVEDDGRGFDLDVNRARSIGLYGMSRRASSVGAQLAVETSPGAGTTVRVTFPGLGRPAAQTEPSSASATLDGRTGTGMG